MYHFEEEIAKGSYGRVLEVSREGQSYAIKEFIVGDRKRSILGAVHLKEVDALKRCRHPFILQPLAITYTCPYYGRKMSDMTDEIFVVMPLAIDSCFEFKRRDECTVPIAKRFMLQITHALAYLHAHKMCYRDVKSANVLVYKDAKYSDAYNAILCDLGMCKPLTNGHINSEHVGTAAYKAPEVMLSPGIYTYSMDVWSLGVLFIEMINIHIPFNRQPDNKGASRMENTEVLTKIFKHLGSPDMSTFNKMTEGGNTIISYAKISKWKPKPIASLFDASAPKVDEFEEISEGLPNFGTLDEFYDLLQKMLAIDPDCRISMAEVLRHPFFSQVPTDGDSPMWRGLCNPPLIEPKPHILKKIANDEKRNIGLDVISQISVDHCNLGYRIMFLGLDLYDRCLLALEEMSVPQERTTDDTFLESESGQFLSTTSVQKGESERGQKIVKVDETDVGLLAYTCCYIACKYFMDEITPDIRMLFPKTSCYEDSRVIQMEKTILMELVKWETYRPTVYDLLDQKTNPATLFVLLKKKTNVYGHSIAKIASQFAKLAQ
uniref:Protein kinase domain-containing protein n=1 Tax=viral metagenome TaxID=1070528 RepID=A0A6C0CJ01_9ZZZZ